MSAVATSDDRRRYTVLPYVWVVNTAEDMTRLFAWGVDGVITDRPDVAMALRKAK